ncbi:MAG TPA: phosphoribosyltransferase family protein [Gaiellaceae bacterium]|nr:phosphoribosyltransferase family protein [Gaiellaceae bacterium]
MRIVQWIEPLFEDRAAAGRELGAALAAHGVDNPIVVGVARGGVAVAAEVARTLEVPLTAIDVERVNALGRRLGATTAGAPAYLGDDHDLPEEEVHRAIEHARRAAAALDERLGHESLAVADRTAIVVDDGLVTGLTLAAACRWARAESATRIVAATPVGRVAGLALLHGEADQVVCPHPLEQLAVVGQAYESFDSLEEWYIAALLKHAARGAD